MAKSFDFIFDFAGPNAYLAHKVLPEFCARTGAVANYIPCLLGGIFKATGNRAPMLRYADAPAKLAYEQLEFTRFIAANKLNRFQFNPHFPVNSLLIMRGAVVAQQDGVFAAYVDAMFAAMWEGGLDLANVDVASQALSNAGLDGPGLLGRASDQQVKDALGANTDAAVARGTFGVPTFFVGDDIYFGKERLGQVAQAVEAL